MGSNRPRLIGDRCYGGAAEPRVKAAAGERERQRRCVEYEECEKLHLRTLPGSAELRTPGGSNSTVSDQCPPASPPAFLGRFAARFRSANSRCNSARISLRIRAATFCEETCTRTISGLPPRAGRRGPARAPARASCAAPRAAAGWAPRAR